MLTGTCLCGACGWELDLPHEGNGATVCNCAACRRYGGIWSYGWIGETIRLTGAPTRGFLRSDLGEEAGLAFHTCPTCGNLMSWQGVAPQEDGRTRGAVNLRLVADPAAIATLRIRRFDGRDTWRSDKSDAPPQVAGDLWI